VKLRRKINVKNIYLLRRPGGDAQAGHQTQRHDDRGPTGLSSEAHPHRYAWLHTSGEDGYTEVPPYLGQGASPALARRKSADGPRACPSHLTDSSAHTQYSQSRAKRIPTTAKQERPRRTTPPSPPSGRSIDPENKIIRDNCQLSVSADPGQRSSQTVSAAQPTPSAPSGASRAPHHVRSSEEPSPVGERAQRSIRSGSGHASGPTATLRATGPEAQPAATPADIRRLARLARRRRQLARAHRPVTSPARS